jgi:hypothetical protein
MKKREREGRSLPAASLESIGVCGMASSRQGSFVVDRSRKGVGANEGSLALFIGVAWHQIGEEIARIEDGRNQRG